MKDLITSLFLLLVAFCEKREKNNKYLKKRIMNIYRSESEGQFKYNQESALGELRSWAPGVKNRIECIYKENNKSHRVYGTLEEMLELAKKKEKRCKSFLCTSRSCVS